MRFTVFALMAMFRSPGVLGWGAVGHEIAATIAQIYLHPSTVEALCDLLPPYASCHLAPIAAWADKVRPFYPWSSHMHYIGDVGDHPSSHCAFGENTWEDPRINVLSAVRNTSVWLKESRDGAEEALKFLVHFLGDMHQPLHLTGRDRGGNDVKVRFDGRITNLHSVWDSRLIAKSLRTIPLNYTRPLPFRRVEAALRNTIYDPYIRQIIWEGIMGRWNDELDEWLVCPNDTTSSTSPSQRPLYSGGAESPYDDEIICPFHWAEPMHQLNCQVVWPASLDDAELRAMTPRRHYIELDTPEYSGRIKDEFLVEKLLATAGIRIAGILNYLLGDSGGSLLRIYQHDRSITAI